LKNMTRALVGVTLTLLVGKDMEPINKTSDTYTQRFLSGTNGQRKPRDIWQTQTFHKIGH